MATIRDARDDDLGGILAIYNHAIETTTSVFANRPHTLEMRREWLSAKRGANLPVIVAAEDDRVLGFATYGPFRTWPGYKYSVEHSVYVALDARGRGFGRALVEEVVRRAREQDLHAIVAGIASENQVSIRLHKKLGFVESASLREVGFKFGRWLDLMFMQLILDTPRHPRDAEEEGR